MGDRTREERGEEKGRLTRILGDVRRVLVLDLAEREHARSLRERRPEVLPHVHDRVDAQPVDGVRLHQIPHPRIERVHDAVVLRVDVREGHGLVPEPALLDVGLVLVVVDEALGVEVRLRGEGLVDVVVWGVGRGRHVVDDDVDHEEHVAPVQLGAEGFQVVRVAEVRVERGDVARPVPMNNRR